MRKRPKYSHIGEIRWKIPFQSMEIVSNQGLHIPFGEGIPGETIKFNLIKIKKHQYQIKDFSIKKRSPSRVQPLCRHFPDCSGCSLLHTSYSKTLEWKKAWIKSLAENHQISIPESFIINGMPHPFHSRFRAVYPVIYEESGIHAGLYRKNSHKLVPLSQCVMVPPEFNLIRNQIVSWAIKNNIEIYNEARKSGWLRYIQIQKGYFNKSVLVSLVVTEKRDQYLGDLWVRLKEVTDHKISGLHLIINASEGNTILTEQLVPKFGEQNIKDSEGRYINLISPTSFFQSNTYMAHRLFQRLKYILRNDGIQSFLELFSGNGTIGFLVSNENTKGLGLELNPSAVNSANMLASEYGFDQLTFEPFDLWNFNPNQESQLIQKMNTFDTLITDPPRKGLGEKLLHAISKSNNKRIYYVSCNPTSFFRDIRKLKTSGYNLQFLQAFDFFPFTSHVELLALLSR